MSRRARRSVAVCGSLFAAAGCLIGLVPGPATAGTAPEWSFKAYANDVRVVPPLVGDWQLGKSRISGSGVGFDGSLRDTWEPHKARYQPAQMRSHVTGYHYRQAAHGVSETLVLNIVIDSTDSPGCAAGDTGKLKLVDSTQKLSNGESADRVSMSWKNDRCPGWVQGWSNEDGGRKTSPCLLYTSDAADE